MHSMETELREITKVKPKAKEEREKFLARLVLAVQELPDADWDKISTAAQNWVNAGAKAYKDDKPVPDFPEADEAPAEEEKPAKKTAAGKTPAKKPAGKAAADDDGGSKKKPAPAAAAKTGAIGMKEQIKIALIDDPSMSVDDIMGTFPKGAELPSRFTVGGIRAEFRHSLKVLKKRNVKIADINI